MRDLAAPRPRAGLFLLLLFLVLFFLLALAGILLGGAVFVLLGFLDPDLALRRRRPRGRAHLRAFLVDGNRAAPGGAHFGLIGRLGAALDANGAFTVLHLRLVGHAHAAAFDADRAFRVLHGRAVGRAHRAGFGRLHGRAIARLDAAALDGEMAVLGFDRRLLARFRARGFILVGFGVSGRSSDRRSAEEEGEHEAGRFA